MLPKGSVLVSKFITGSRLYGTNTPESDTDIRGVFIAPKEYYFGFKIIEQCRSSEADTELLEIRKFMMLCANNNPNIIEFLFVPVLIETSPEWNKIIENRSSFVSKKVKHTFMGYAFSQLKRIKSHRSWLLNPPKKKPERKDFDLPEDRSLISGDQIGAFNEIISNYLEQVGDFHELRDQLIEMNEKHNYKAIIKNIENLNFNSVKDISGLSDNLLYALAKEKAYEQACRHFKQYENWKNTRNPARAKLEEKFGYDTKHASHLYRLVSECKDLLQTGNLTFPLPNAEHIKNIKEGHFTYEKVVDDFEKEEKEVEGIYEASSLPRSANMIKIENLCMNIVQSSLIC